jgi:putative nucleotidyltransferase with HDIG domain
VGLTAPPAYTPFGGVFKRFATNRDHKSQLFRYLVGYSSCLAVAAGSLAIALPLAGWGIGSYWTVLALGLIAAYAERGSVRLTATTEVSISLVPTLFTAVLYGPLAAMVVAAISNVTDLKSKTDLVFLKWMTYTASRAITAAAAGFAAVVVASQLPSGVAALSGATAAAAIVSEGFDAWFCAVTHRLRGNGRMRSVFRTVVPLMALSLPLYAPIVALLVAAYEQISPWTLPLFMVPGLAAQRLYGLYETQRALTADVVRAYERLESANLSFATALVATLEARDRYTAGHSAAVAIYSRDIASRMGLSSEQQQLAHVCGLVHDIGKVGLPAGLLEKPGALTLEERRLMEQHSAIGEHILAKVADYSEIARIVRHHHERVDGNGYPDSLVAEDIPLLSQIIAVADAYDAMTSDRPYRDAMPSRVARLRLAQAVESQFDTSVVAAFEVILAAASEEYRVGAREDFVLESQATDAESSPRRREMVSRQERRFSARANAELLEYTPNVHLNRDLADEESLSNVAVG